MRSQTPSTVLMAAEHAVSRVIPQDGRTGRTSRRSFLGGTLAASCVAVGPLPVGGLFAAGPQRLRIGLVGCGGRGTGAAQQALAADPSVQVVSLGDVFPDQVASAADVLSRSSADQFACPPSAWFVGPDACRQVIESGVDVVLLAGPPHVRPLHLELAIAAGKHVYCEKPVAIDAAGVVRAAAAAARGRANGLALVSGFCFRRDARVLEMVARIHDGAIGRTLAVHAHAAIGLPWRKPLDSSLADGSEAGFKTGLPAGSWPLRNWVSFNRFSGGHFVEHHVQAIDRAIWILGDESPVLAEPLESGPAGAGPGFTASAGRPDNAATGAIGDCRAATAVRYTFADGRTLEASLDRRERDSDRIVETAVGSAGRCDVARFAIAGTRAWTAEPAAGPSRFVATVEALVRGILSGRVAHDGDTMCRSTRVAVMGSMAAEAGRSVAWNELTEDASTLA